MEKHYTEKFDNKIDELEIYQKYPILKPFIGNKYFSDKKPVLFIGESHYLPKKFDGISDTEWYNKKIEDFNFEDALCWLDPRHIINNDVINSQFKNNSHSIYRNVAKVYGEVFETGDFRESLKYIVFYNYFLRPAEITGKSIENDPYTDNQISFETLLSLNKILNPNKIVFASKKAKVAFDSIFDSEDYTKNKDIDLSKIKSIPHPGCRWWNTQSKPYNDKTGKNYLKQILTND